MSYDSLIGMPMRSAANASMAAAGLPRRGCPRLFRGRRVVPGVLATSALLALRPVLVAASAATHAEHVHGHEDPTQQDPDPVVRQELRHDLSLLIPWPISLIVPAQGDGQGLCQELPSRLESLGVRILLISKVQQKPQRWLEMRI